MAFTKSRVVLQSAGNMGRVALAACGAYPAPPWLDAQRPGTEHPGTQSLTNEGETRLTVESTSARSIPISIFPVPI